MQREILTLQAAAEAREVNVQELQKEILGLRATANKLTQERSDAENTVEQLSKAKEALESSTMANVEHLSQEKRELLARIESQASELQTLSQQKTKEIEDLKEENLALEKTLENVQKASEESEARAARLRAQVADITEKQTSVSSKLQEREQEIQLLQSTVAQKEDALGSSMLGHNEQVLDYERKLQEMEARHKQVMADCYRTFELERDDILNNHGGKVSALLEQIESYPS